MGFLRSRSALICLAVLVSLAGVCTPGLRSFAGTVASKLAGIRCTNSASLRRAGPIPYILDLSKRKHARRPAATRAATPKPAKPAAPANAPNPDHREDIALPQSH